MKRNNLWKMLMKCNFSPIIIFWHLWQRSSVTYNF
jgi:hypothetical protein